MMTISQLPICLAFAMNLKMWLAVALLASMGVFWVIYFLLERQKKQKAVRAKAAAPVAPPRQSRAPFDDLCERHHLSGEEISELKATAQANGLAQPAVLFLEPTHLMASNSAVAQGLVAKLFGAGVVAKAQ